MFIPIIEKDIKADDFTCRDGEIEIVSHFGSSGISSLTSDGAETYCRATIEAKGTYPTANIRIALQSGDREKANLLINGDISRVDPATAERLTQAIMQKAAECLLDISTDYRRRGLFILPFRFYTMTMLPDGTLSLPSPQAIALPCDFPPHPEITAASATEEALVIALRFPVRPHRLVITPTEDLPSGHALRTYISYPLYIPDPKEMRGSIGSVKTVSGGTATGIRFTFLSTSSIKASVASPEKYYEFVGNERTGYRLSSKAASVPDYSCYADIYGYVPPFAGESMAALGDDADPDTDPLDWIADWRKAGEGYLPALLPYKYCSDGDGESDKDGIWPEGIDKDEISESAESMEMPYILLTRPMVLAGDIRSRRNATPRAIRSMKVHGLDDTPSVAILYGSDDCRHWTAMRRFDPHGTHLLLTPRRFWWRLLLYGKQPFRPAALALEIY